jgi:hypothetical protein
MDRQKIFQAGNQEMAPNIVKWAHICILMFTIDRMPTKVSINNDLS